MVTIVRLLTHLRREYRLFRRAEGSELRTAQPQTSLDGGKTDFVKTEGSGTVPDEMGFPVEVEVQITDVNIFVYGLVPGMLMCCKS